MPAPASATRHYRRLQRLKAVLLASTRRSWRRMGSDGSWERQYETVVGPQLTALVTAAQVTATRESDVYVAEVLNELDFGPPTEPGAVRERSLAGVTGDGRPVDTLLATAVGRARAAEAAAREQSFGADGDGFLTVTARRPSTEETRQAGLNAGEAFLDTVAQSILEDAMRAAEDVAMVQRPWVDGWVRMINPPCCSRCAVLSGKFFLFSEGFLRHPRCDCYHIPAPKDRDKVRALIDINSPERYFESLTEAEQDRIFTRAGAQAIRDGADIGRVVNARRGMSKAQDTGRLERRRVGGRDLYTTTELTTRRARRSQVSAVRLMPESILEIAGDDRDEALRLLRENGYIL